jgi:hypothetical protein
MEFKVFYVLDEVTAEEKFTKQYTGKLDRALFDKAVALDPTSVGDKKVGKYADWIIRNKLFDTKPEVIKDLLGKFEKYKEKLDPAKRDINRLKYDDLESLIKDAEEKGVTVSKKEKVDIAKAQAEKESEIVFQNENYVVVSPKTKFASRYFGAGADWCTARQEDAYCLFDRYASNGTLYIIKDKSNNKKYQIWIGNRGNVESKNERNRDFNPREEFSDDQEMIDWLNDELKLPDPSQITDEEAEELAERFVNREVKIENDELRKDAIDIVKNIFTNVNDYGMDDPGFNAVSYVEEQSGEMSYYFEKIMEMLEATYFIKADDDNNKLNVLSWLDFGEGLHYDIERAIEKHEKPEILDNERMKWVYTYDEDVESMVDRFDGEIDFDYIEKWLAYKYDKNYDEFETFYDDFVKEFGVKNIDDADKEKLKDLVDKVEKVEYGKADHPKLDLQSYREFLKKYLR